MLAVDDAHDAADHHTIAPGQPIAHLAVGQLGVALRIVESLPPGRFLVLWFQPGAFNAEVVAAAQTKAEQVIAGPCIMVET